MIRFLADQNFNGRVLQFRLKQDKTIVVGQLCERRVDDFFTLNARRLDLFQPQPMPSDAAERICVKENSS